MEQLYAPWRKNYVTDEHKKKHNGSKDECVFCSHIKNTDLDEQNFILKRMAHTIVMLNLYPYNGGHLLIIPYTHTDNLGTLSIEERNELMEATNESIEILKKTINPQGFNIGLNIGGKAAGGSVPEHIHMHVLPRWLGDTSFLPTLSETKPISEDLAILFKKLKKAYSTEKP